jgi:hypothetical protein
MPMSRSDAVIVALNWLEDRSNPPEVTRPVRVASTKLTFKSVATNDWADRLSLDGASETSGCFFENIGTLLSKDWKATFLPVSFVRRHLTDRLRLPGGELLSLCCHLMRKAIVL